MNSSDKRNSVCLESAQILHQQVQNCWFWNLRIWRSLKECEQLPKVHLGDYANSKNIRIYWRILKNLLEFCRNKQHLIGTIGIWNLPKFTNMFFSGAKFVNRCKTAFNAISNCYSHFGIYDHLLTANNSFRVSQMILFTFLRNTHWNLTL